MKKSLLLLLFSFSIIAFGNSTMNFDKKQIRVEKSSTSKNSSFTVDLDMVSIDGSNCYTINVRISSYNDTLGKFLVAGQNVQVGDTNSNKNRNKIKPEEINCQAGTLLNGDKVLPSKLKFKHCLTEFLNNPEHEEVYGQYLVKKRELIDSL